jgi:hypothetical protein
MVIKYNNIFDSKALQILPKLGFLFWKQTIWQPWFTDIPVFQISIQTNKGRVHVGTHYIFEQERYCLPVYFPRNCCRCDWHLDKQLPSIYLFALVHKFCQLNAGNRNVHM